MSVSSPRNAVFFATAGAVLMMAHHVGAKSVRDALFLSSFDIKSLPLMVIAASGFSLLLAWGASVLMRRHAPASTAPLAFLVSAALYAAIGLALPSFPRASAVILFLLVVGTGTLLTSGLWSLISECFDPNAVRKNVGRVAAGGTAGIFAGGLLAERVGALWSITAMIPVLVVLHILCAFAAYRLARGVPAVQTFSIPGAPPQDRVPLRKLIRGAPYLVPLSLLVVAGATAAGLIDFVFKSEAAGAFDSRESLLRFFAVFNAGAGMITFLLQSGASRWVLERLGIGKTLATLPVTTALSSFGALLAPGLWVCGFARGAEAAVRGSFFRAGYELFYAPVPESQKRAAKPIIDVGFDRLGDGLAGGLVRGVLFAVPAFANQAILTAAVLLGIAGFWIAMRLDDAYVEVLEGNLRRRAEDLELSQFSGSIFSSMTLMRLPTEGLSGIHPSLLPKEPAPGPAGPLTEALLDLTSGAPVRIRRTLADSQHLAPLLAPAVIDLLTLDPVYPDAVRALRKSAASHVGQLLDRLLLPGEDVKMRRRIPRVLAHCPVQRAVDGLLLGLGDSDFDVRFRCAQALAALSAANPALRFPTETVCSAILRETARGQASWDESRLFDAPFDPEIPLPAAATLQGLHGPSLDYAFTLLSLILPRDPLRIAYHGLYTNDAHLRGTALEYLESVLPPEIHQALWPFLTGDQAQPRRAGRSGAAVEEELLRSEPFIQLNLRQRRRP